MLCLFLSLGHSTFFFIFLSLSIYIFTYGPKDPGKTCKGEQQIEKHTYIIKICINSLSTSGWQVCYIYIYICNSP